MLRFLEFACDKIKTFKTASPGKTPTHTSVAESESMDHISESDPRV